MMHNEIEMSMMGYLRYFLGLQIYKTKEGTFINQFKLCQRTTKEILNGKIQNNINSNVNLM